MDEMNIKVDSNGLNIEYSQVISNPTDNTIYEAAISTYNDAIEQVSAIRSKLGCHSKKD